MTRRPLAQAVAAAVAGGVDWVQLRDRSLAAGALLALLDELRGAAGSRARWLVNRRLDVVLAGGADGVHLGFDALPPSEARRLLAGDAGPGPGREVLVGVSCHAPDEVAQRAREAEGADYAHLAPIQDPFSKRPERPALGFDALTEAARHGLPVLAQGGIHAGNAALALAAGAAGVAVTGAILGQADPGAAAARLRSALDAPRG